jgi:hypothetical protein
MATKPVISYIAKEIIPLTPQLNVSIVRKKLTKTSYRDYNNKTELTDYVDTLYVPPTSDCIVYVKCQCGAEYEYANKTAVPSVNLTCACGRKVVEYGS